MIMPGHGLKGGPSDYARAWSFSRALTGSAERSSHVLEISGFRAWSLGDYIGHYRDMYGCVGVLSLWGVDTWRAGHWMSLESGKLERVVSKLE